MSQALALLLHSADLAPEVQSSDLYGLLRDAGTACDDPEALSYAALVQDGRLVLAIEGPAELVSLAPQRLAGLSWLRGGLSLPALPAVERLFAGWRPRLAQVHPAFEGTVREQLAQWRARPDAANRLAVLRLLQGLAPQAQG